MPDERVAVAGIVLAAGTSSRMGTNKLLMELEGETVVWRTVRQAQEAGLDPVIVVLGFEAAMIVDALHGLDVRTVINDRYERGINTSVHAGISRVPEECSGAVIMLADMPLVTTEMLTTITDRYRTGRETLVLSLYGDVHAPPTLYDRSLFSEFDGQEGEGCGRRIVRTHWDQAHKVRWSHDLLADLDRPEDVERVRAKLIEANAT